MTLITAHKILISVSILFFAGFALRALFLYSSQGGTLLLLSGSISALATLGLAVYLKAFLRSLRK